MYIHRHRLHRAMLSSRSWAQLHRRVIRVDVVCHYAHCTLYKHACKQHVYVYITCYRQTRSPVCPRVSHPRSLSISVPGCFSPTTLCWYGPVMNSKP